MDLLLCYLRFRRGGGNAALLRVGYIYPPRQALCLRMVYKVLYSNFLFYLPFLLIILPYPPDPKDILR